MPGFSKLTYVKHLLLIEFFNSLTRLSSPPSRTPLHATPSFPVPRSYSVRFASVVVPIYLGELAPPTLRGTLGTMTQFAMVIGILASNLMAFPFATLTGWRILFAVTPVLAAVELICMPLIFESPRCVLLYILFVCISFLPSCLVLSCHVSGCRHVYNRCIQCSVS